MFSSHQILAQYDAPLYTSYTTGKERLKLYERLTKNAIIKNLSVSLNDSTEQQWEDAFGVIELLQYKSAFSDKKVTEAFEIINKRSVDFQKSIIEMAFSNYPKSFSTEVKQLLATTGDPKVFAMCAEYLLQQNDSVIEKNIIDLLNKNFTDQSVIDPILFMLQAHIGDKKNAATPSKKILTTVFSKQFLPGQIVMYSVQRKNRDYPGIVVIRNRDGKLITDSTGAIFNVPQLARSITNLPFYITNGNTPQGIFLMHGFGVSMSNFIGPTANIQLSMPVEESIKRFLRDSSVRDTVWNIGYYKNLIPQPLQDYLPLYNSYYAGLGGRTEIIAHGTTIDPNFYLNKPYFPLTPTQGCLCTREIWNGKRLESDQQKLVNALLKAGGADGYCLVIDLDDKQSEVTLKDILPYLIVK